MSNFSEYIKTEQSTKKENIKSNTQSMGNEKVSNEKLEDMINKYSGYSNDKLMKEFIELTLEKKRRGELSQGELDNIKKTILPFLNEEQKKSLDNLINMVNNV